MEKIKAGLKKLFTTNVGLKLASLAIAVVMWFVVVNVTDPLVTQTFRNISVTVLNENLLTADGKVMEIVDDSNVLSAVTIKAPRSVMQEFDSASGNILVTADMKNLSSDETAVPLIATVTKYSDKVDSIKLSSEFLYVNVENRKTIQLPIRATTSGTVESGYVIGNISQATNQVRISGPESVVEKIKSASVDVQITGFREKISTSADIVLYDAEGNVIPDDNLSMNVDAVKVDVEILATKKVPVVLQTMGVPAEGCAFTGEIECEVEEVVIAGNQTLIDGVSQITVPADALNLTGLSSSLHAVVNLTSYLPAGVRFADSTFSGNVNVIAYIEAYREENYSVYLRNINIENIPEGFSGTSWVMSRDYVEFTLVGLAQDLEKVQLSELNFSIDFSDYALMNEISGFNTKTTYELPLLMDLPEGVKVADTVLIWLKLVK